MKALSPVLLIIYNRPHETRRVLHQIRKAQPSQLFVVADGAKSQPQEDYALVTRARAVIDEVDWPCEVFTLFRSENLGLKRSVGEGIDWFFEQVDEGIILEDDCLPHEDFFSFCDELLLKYRDNKSVSVITGNNFQDGLWRGEGSYYFSCYPHVWGWATWKRSWKNYDPSIRFWPELRKSNRLRSLFSTYGAHKFWRSRLDAVYKGHFDSTWDYSWHASLWRLGGLTVTPNVNLVSNIGFSASATHSKNETSDLSRLDTHEIGAIVHPKSVNQNFDADQFTFRKVFGHDFHSRIGFFVRLYKAFVFVKARTFPSKGGRS